MLTGPGLRNDAPLFHAHGQQHLADGIVDLMCAGMAQVFPFQINLCAAQLLGQPIRTIETRRTPDILLEVVGQVCLKSTVLLRLDILRFQFEERRHEGFRHIATPIGSESAMAIWEHRHVNLSS